MFKKKQTAPSECAVCLLVFLLVWISLIKIRNLFYKQHGSVAFHIRQKTLKTINDTSWKGSLRRGKSLTKVSIYSPVLAYTEIPYACAVDLWSPASACDVHSPPPPSFFRPDDLPPGTQILLITWGFMCSIQPLTLSPPLAPAAASLFLISSLSMASYGWGSKL